MTNPYEQKIEEQFEQYGQWVNNFAEQVFKARIKPWLDKYHLTLSTGMGGFSFHYTDQTPAWFVQRYKDEWVRNTNNALDKYKLDSRIIGIMESDVEGFGCNLGSLMENYPREEGE